MRSSAGQRNPGLTNDAGSRESPHHRAIDMGLGAAVNLNSTSGLSQPQVNPYVAKTPQQPIANVPPGQTISYTIRNSDVRSNIGFQPTPLSVRLPPHQQQQQQPQPLPIQRQVSPQSYQQSPEKRFPVAPPQSYPDLYKPSYLSNSVVSSPGQQAATYVSRVQVQCEPRNDLNEAVQPSRPRMVAPEPVDEIDKEAQEEDDVFDEKAVSPRKPPPLSGVPRLKRGFSNIIENEGLVFEARHNVQNDILKDSHDNMYVQTFVLPDLTAYSEDFRAFLGKELVETSTLVSLEQAAMWGIHDRQLILRKELHETLTKAAYKDALYRRWRYQQTLTNKQSGLVFSEAEWQEEWSNILRLASTRPRGAADPMRSNNCCDGPLTQGCEDPVVYESLEEFHVFVLAHVLRRPIIVVADAILKDSRGEALAPIPFPGIYLPLEVHPCYRSPLLLTYDAAHFSALAPMEQDPNISPQLPAAIPLVDPELKLLPLHFHIDPGAGVNWAKDICQELSLEDKINMLQKFLDVDRLPLKLADVNGDSDRGSMGSQDSDDLGAPLTALGKDKDKKKDEKRKDAKVSQQMQNVAKQFGSIGKSMSKKLKQLGKVGKGDKSRRPSVGNEITQSTRIPNYGNNANNNEIVLVAKLSEKRGKQQQEMIRNYLSDAKERFESDRELKRRSDAELRSKVARHPAVNSTALCKTPGCNLYGTSHNNFYCSACYAAWQQDASRGGGQVIYNTFPGRHRGQQNLDFPKPTDEIFIYGKSKFYTSSNEDIKQPPSENFLTASEKDQRYSRPTSDVLRPRTRSPTPDYDNVPRPHSIHPVMTTQRSTNSSSSAATSSMPCKTSGCEFYGASSYDGLCSKCYQQRHSKNYRPVQGNTNTKL
ncbi:otu domain-containing protein 7b [Plakobranchus ocellatus]|uniref:ubiquitinyl hydrolase 1 n=1 Tax=Plakobranchus ocellatus TaxID=259542 RepID=A0AAV3YUF5_9GAST|nr:otu domain-containing protein 7b [Plakobranchus ocellatus]